MCLIVMAEESFYFYCKVEVKKSIFSWSRLLVD